MIAQLPKISREKATHAQESKIGSTKSRPQKRLCSQVYSCGSNPTCHDSDDKFESLRALVWLVKFQLLYQTEVAAILGSAADGDKAKKSRRIMIKTGIKRNNKGGGDNGGNTSGSTSKDTVSTTMATMDLKLNSLNINFYAKT
ncbi:unnamed protein product [Dovyalis caffra]|uniref:Uncharacterized protein n=1 Tax=Dovyalis caffra TaxID=77055 RepID=A0AAV1RXE4_9ROSI|nr:unnamed protein product [Dovyalis caffra]